MAKKQRILVALSGGVDSAVALYLLKKKGYQVEAAFMKNFSEKVNIKSECPWKEDRLMAYRVAAFLNVPIRTFDFEKEYHKKVVEYIFTTYQKGATPNPDVLCNNEIKFKLFLDKAIALGFDKIATGHYARVKEDKSGFHLLKGLDPAKDQVYFLAGLNQKQLSKVIFPIGHLKKTRIREIAKKAKLPNALRPDSQGICFIGKINLKTFLQQKIKPKKGDIVDTTGRVLGMHQGVWYYTIGQRQGIGLSNGPWYVVEKNTTKNKLVVAKENDARLYQKNITIENIHWLNKRYKLPLVCQAQIRYRQAWQKAILHQDSIDFTLAQKGVASGQIIAVYLKNELIASATIK